MYIRDLLITNSFPFKITWNFALHLPASEFRSKETLPLVFNALSTELSLRGQAGRQDRLEAFHTHGIGPPLLALSLTQSGHLAQLEADDSLHEHLAALVVETVGVTPGIEHELDPGCREQFHV